MKFGDLEAVRRLHICKKKHLTKGAASLKTLVGLTFARKKVAVNTASTKELIQRWIQRSRLGQLSPNVCGAPFNGAL